MNTPISNDFISDVALSGQNSNDQVLGLDSNATAINCGCLFCQTSLSTVNRQLSSNLNNQNVSLQQTNGQPYYVNALLPQGEPRWNSDSPVGTPVTITYSFMTAVPSYYNPSVNGTISYGGEDTGTNFTPFTEAQKALARQALSLYSSIANIRFVEVSDAGAGGTMRFGYANPNFNAVGWAYNPSAYPVGGDVWLSNASSLYTNPTPGSLGFFALIHEIGHALGLKHPFERGITLPFAQDNHQYSIMSYTEHPDMFGASPRTPQLYDISAIQYLYGANPNTRSGNTTYSWDTNATFIETIWDGGGIDRISARNQVRDALINLKAGSFSSIGADAFLDAENNLAIAYNVTIENAIGGSGNDTITGNRVANRLRGGSGEDTLMGGRSNDTLVGGGSNDILLGGSGHDTLTGGAGADSFVLHTPSARIDTITDFTQLQGDLIVVSASQYGGELTTGFLSEDKFVIGSAAVDASERFIYNSTTGRLFFDADGIGTQRQVHLATLSTGLSLSSSDIFVIA